MKPRVIVETGLDKGLGTCVLAAAVLKNRGEGAPGTVHTIDISPVAGWLIEPPYSDVVRLVYSDLHAALREMKEPIDLFIHDSAHSYEHESGEFEIISQRLSEGALILSDNAHALPTLMDFAEAHGLVYHFWSEKPADHFYPGAGIGLVVFSNSPGE